MHDPFTQILSVVVIVVLVCMLFGDWKWRKL